MPQNKNKQQHFPSVFAGLLLTSASSALAAVPFHFSAGQSVYNVAPGASVTIPLYLTQDTGITTIADQGGVFSVGLTVQRLGSDPVRASIASFLLVGSFNGTVISSNSADALNLYADHASGIGPGEVPDAFGRVAIGTLTVSTPAGVDTLTQFSISDDDALTDNTVTYGGVALDRNPGIASGTFSVIAIVPEPSVSSLGFALAAMGLVRCRRGKAITAG